MPPPSSNPSPRGCAWTSTACWSKPGRKGLSQSFHLKALTHAQLVSVVQEGRYQRYRANLALMQDLIGYLTAECCAGHPELCAETCLEPICA